MCWVIHTVVTRSWAVSGRVNHNLQLTTICALLAKTDVRSVKFAGEFRGKRSHAYTGVRTRKRSVCHADCISGYFRGNNITPIILFHVRA